MSLTWIYGNLSRGKWRLSARDKKVMSGLVCTILVEILHTAKSVKGTREWSGSSSFTV